MAIDFRDVSLGSLRNFSAEAPSGAVIGIVGAASGGQEQLLQLAGGVASPEAGEIRCGPRRRYLAVADPLDLSAADVIAIHHTFGSQDALSRAHARLNLDRLRALGATVLLASQEAELIRALCDEVWWLEKGALWRRGDPGETWKAYQESAAEQFRSWGSTQSPSLSPSFRRGDGRAEIVLLETLGGDGLPTTVWRSGEPVSIRVAVRYREAVDDPVVGIMIRTRVGSEVYGTNTELEQVQIGPCAPGLTVQLEFAFRGDLCNNEYTITVASHDRDGVAHDWLDDAIAFTVADSRYTAGVANLRAKVSILTTVG